MMAEKKSSQIKDGFTSAFKFILPNSGLILVICLYALVGGYIFQHLESTNEKTECVEKMNTYITVENRTLQDMLSIMVNYRTPGDSQSAIMAFRKQLLNFRNNLFEISYTGINCSLLGKDGGTSYQWSLPGSILFSTTIFTTVGYGNIAPKTNWGRMVCIAYAILGIPLMLLTLANIGEVMANIFRYTYFSICCCGFLKWIIRYKPLFHKKDYLRQKQITSFATVYDDDTEDEDLEKISVPVIVTLFLIGSYIFLGALLFGEWLNLNWMDAAYFSFITFSTVGFGDIVPGTDDINSTNAQLKMFGTALYMVIGMAILSMAFNLVQEEVVDKIIWIENIINSAKKINEMKNK